MLPANLTSLEVLDLGIQGESLALRMYDSLAKRVQVPTLQTRFSQLKKDEKDHRELFPGREETVSEEEAAEIFGIVDANDIQCKESLIQTLYGAIRFEEYSAYFYEKMQYKMPSRESRIFMEVLADEGRTHAEILKQQIEAVRTLELAIDDRGRTVEVM